MKPFTWKARALAAEATVARLTEAASLAEQALTVAQDRPVLTSITRVGRKIRFMFVRNNALTTIETVSTWDDDIETWQKELLHD